VGSITTALTGPSMRGSIGYAAALVTKKNPLGKLKPCGHMDICSALTRGDLEKSPFDGRFQAKVVQTARQTGSLSL
jgi:hypothetical protein